MIPRPQVTLDQSLTAASKAATSRVMLASIPRASHLEDSYFHASEMMPYPSASALVSTSTSAASASFFLGAMLCINRSAL